MKRLGLRGFVVLFVLTWVAVAAFAANDGKGVPIKGKEVSITGKVTLTPPYFHDGQVSTLPEAVRLMAWMQLDTVLSPDEIDETLRFLRTLEAEHPVNAGPRP